MNIVSPSAESGVSVDLKGAYVLPGLIDCHVHLMAGPGSKDVSTLFSTYPSTIHHRSAYTARSMLHRGFTTVRDTGGADAGLKAAIDEYLVHGPRLFISGKALSQSGGHADMRQTWESNNSTSCCGGAHSPSLGRLCDGVPDCAKAAREELRQGADFLKIMVGGGVASPTDPLQGLQFLPEEIRAITTTAQQRGTYVTAHAYTNKAIRHAVENGVESIEHGNFVSKETAEWCKQKGLRAVIPTLTTYQAMDELEGFLPPSGRAKNHRVLEAGLRALKTWEDAGVMVCYGTDLLSGMQEQQLREFSIRWQAMKPEEVLRSATVNGAKLLGMEGKIGVIKEGAFADLLILGRNPLEDLSVLDWNNQKDRFAVLKEGRVVTSSVTWLGADEVYRSS
ncbi:MAG: hypothetical protein Q9227_005095 [Pyrenula ochraceoflavens]